MASSCSLGLVARRYVVYPVFLAAATRLLAVPGLKLLEVRLEPDQIVITATPRAEVAACPVCQGLSRRVHSGYTRRAGDLPWGPRRVVLHLQVRRFFCDTVVCPRKVFTERLPDLLAPYARRTQRLQYLLERLAFEVGGEAGAVEATRLGFGHPSGDTLLRLIRRAVQPELPTPRCLGVDDWAMKRRLSYGTILCDLEQRRIVDLLPGRDGPTLAAWLQAHPGVEIITRDRSGSYADGAKQGAPGAIQVADRFHLLTNLTGIIKQILQRYPDALRPAGSSPEGLAQPTVVTQGRAPKSPSSSLPGPLAGLQHRQANYQAVQTLHTQGLSIRVIARQLHLAINTVNKYIHLPKPPERLARTSRKLQGHELFMQRRWNDGERRAKVLFRELKRQGYRGSYRTVARYVARLRGPHPATQADLAAAAPVPPLTVSQAAKLMTCQPDQLLPEQQTQLAQLRQVSEEISEAYDLGQQFQEIVRERQAEQLSDWLEQALHSSAPSLRGMATSLMKDREAVSAALSQPWSNGPVEGHINRLKQIKRQMYGRGHLDLLKRRVMWRRTSP